MAKNHGSQIKDDEQYEALRDKGMSKNKAARIANSNAQGSGGSNPASKRGGKSSQYEDKTKDELQQQAKKVGIKGRSKMDRASSSTRCATTDAGRRGLHHRVAPRDGIAAELTPRRSRRRAIRAVPARPPHARAGDHALTSHVQPFPGNHPWSSTEPFQTTV